MDFGREGIMEKGSTNKMILILMTPYMRAMLMRGLEGSFSALRDHPEGHTVSESFHVK